MDDWFEAEEEARKDGLQLIEIDNNTDLAPLESFFQQALPHPIQVLLEHYQENGNIWDALVRSAVSVNSHIHDDIFSARFFPALQQILSKSSHLAIFYGQSRLWSSPDPWGYLVETQTPSSISQMILHLPASPTAFEEVETMLQIQLPKSYRQLLSLSNGVGFDARELRYICGAGAQRTNWIAVQSEYEPLQKNFHEITSVCRWWKSIYDYESELDEVDQVNTFQRDYNTVAPFAYTFDWWCFDLNNLQTELPIMLWDHEDRSATVKAANFSEWFHSILTQDEE